MSTEAILTTSMTVNEAIQRVPAAVKVFAHHGIDACCGGSLLIEEAARRHGVDLDTLLRQIDELAGR